MAFSDSMEIEDSLQIDLQVSFETLASPYKQTKLFWSSELEQAALELYIQALRSGKQSDNGFKPETHCAVQGQPLVSWVGGHQFNCAFQRM